MPKILITGNGFDLSIGLPTTYSDFIRILRYTETNRETDFVSVFSQCAEFEKIQKTFKQFKIDDSNLIKLRSLIKQNIWYQFFKHEFEIETWIDFENKIEYVLKILFSSIENLKSKIFHKGSIEKNESVYNASLFNGSVEIIEVLKVFNIISTRQGIYDIRLNDEYLIRKYEHFVDINIDKITKKLIKELIDFKLIFSLFFETFIFPLYNGMSLNISKTLFNSINRHYTFNYTPTFEKVFISSSKTSFLHGRINSNENKIVLGINEIPIKENIDLRHFLPFTKYFQKLNNGTDYNFIQEFASKKNHNYLFFFWGHSLDKSDEDYINEVFDFVAELSSSSQKKIIVIYHSEKSKESLLLNLLNIRGKKNIQDLMRRQILEFYTIDNPKLLSELKKDFSNSPSISIR